MVVVGDTVRQYAECYGYVGRRQCEHDGGRDEKRQADRPPPVDEQVEAYAEQSEMYSWEPLGSLAKAK